jgi:hypothetical protein
MEQTTLAPWLAEAVAQFTAIHGPRRCLEIIIRDRDDHAAGLVLQVPGPLVGPERPQPPPAQRDGQQDQPGCEHHRHASGFF